MVHTVYRFGDTDVTVVAFSRKYGITITITITEKQFHSLARYHNHKIFIEWVFTNPLIMENHGEKIYKKIFSDEIGVRHWYRKENLEVREKIKTESFPRY